MLEKLFGKKENDNLKQAVVNKKRKLRGVVVSDKMKKTIVVAVENLKTQAKYKKNYKMTSRFKVHDEKNEYHVGDKVLIEETKPLSKEKRWKVINKF